MDLTGKIEINAMLVSQSILIPLSSINLSIVLAVRHKSAAINAAEQNVSVWRDIVLQARLSWEDRLHKKVDKHDDCRSLSAIVDGFFCILYTGQTCLLELCSSLCS